VANSYAKEVYVNHGGAEHMYRVGTLARLNVVDGMATPLAQAEFELIPPEFRPPLSQRRGADVCQAHRADLCLRAGRGADQPSGPPARPGCRRLQGRAGVAHIEAPRGTLIHDYEIDNKGIVRAANMIIATQQNTAAINKSLKEGANNLMKEGTDELMLNALEFVVRCYDPCLACSTHAIGRMAMKVEIRHQGRVVRELWRN
jgi:coenzyme F420-reducing hydrogenase alpha subunit